MNRFSGVWKVCLIFIGLGLPFLAEAQDVSGELNGLHAVLDQLYDEMIPMCSQLMGVGRGIAGFAATWYIAVRVWRHISNAEPIDFFPLFRPFVLGFAVMIFPSVLEMINGVMKPVVNATASMVTDSNKAVKVLLEEKEKAIKQTKYWQMYVGVGNEGNFDMWYKYTYPDKKTNDDNFLEGIGNDIQFAMAKQMYNFRNTVKEWMSEVLQVLFQAASLCIDTLRTFQLIVLAILGPLVFGIATFDGFQHTLSAWIAKYLNVFLWLPACNIFGGIIGKIQEKMLALDLSQIQEQGDTFFSNTDVAYLVFLIIGIIGYFTVPSIAGFIVNAGGNGGLANKATGMFNAGAGITAAAGAAGAGAGLKRAVRGASNILNTPGYIAEGYYSKDNKGNNNYMKDKLSPDQSKSKS